MTEDKQTYGQYLDALRVKLGKAEETHERNHRIFVKFKIESEAEIASLRAKLERARLGFLDISENTCDRYAKDVAKANLEGIKE